MKRHSGTRHLGQSGLSDRPRRTLAISLTEDAIRGLPDLPNEPPRLVSLSLAAECHYVVGRIGNPFRIRERIGNPSYTLNNPG